MYQQVLSKGDGSGHQNLAFLEVVFVLFLEKNLGEIESFVIFVKLSLVSESDLEKIRYKTILIILFSGVKSGAPEDEPVCEECSQTRNLIHCIDASIQVLD